MTFLLRYKNILVTIIALIVGVGIGWFSHAAYTAPTVMRGTVLRDDTVQYPLISPLLACDVGPEDAFPEFLPIKQSLQPLINDEVQTGNTSEVSVYVRSLKGGRWFDINGDATYAPASMLKVFIMLAYYKEAEDNPGVLQKQVSFQATPNSASETPGEVIPHLTGGALYSVDDIIRQMIVYSDNDALNTLVDNFDPDTLAAFNGIFTELNIPSPAKVSESTFNFMSVSEYSLVFRVLYGATYLDDPYSEKALELLSQAQYKGGIVAGVPSGISVAHKFGVTTVPASSGSPQQNELHDCGVVYYSTHPYLLCIMTKGSDFASLQKDIADISKATYEGISSFYESRPTPTAAATTTNTK